MKKMSRIAALLGALPYVVSGAEAFLHPADHRERARQVTPLAESLGITVPDATLDAAGRALGAAFVVGGVAMAAGSRAVTRPLALLQIPVAAMNNPVWARPGWKEALGFSAGVGVAAAAWLAGDRR